MATYKTVVELPIAELNTINEMMKHHDTPMTLEYLKSIEEVCKVSWAFQGVTEDIGYLDRIITAEFENGMVMDIWVSGEIGAKGGYYAGISFGDRYELFVEAGEHTDNCYPLDNKPRSVIDGIYSMYYNGDIYELEIKSK